MEGAMDLDVLRALEELRLDNCVVDLSSGSILNIFLPTYYRRRQVFSSRNVHGKVDNFTTSVVRR